MSNSSSQIIASKLSDALDLLALLEMVTDAQTKQSLGKSSCATVPWGGIRLTIQQTKNLLKSVCGEVTVPQQNSVVGQREEEEEEDNNGYDFSDSPALAHRIKKSPAPRSNIRDLFSEGADEEAEDGDLALSSGISSDKGNTGTSA